MKKLIVIIYDDRPWRNVIVYISSAKGTLFVILFVIKVPLLQHSTGQIIKSHASFCQSVCHRSNGRNFCSILMKLLMKFCTEVRGPKSKNAFVRDQNPTTPLFYPNSPPLNAF